MQRLLLTSLGTDAWTRPAATWRTRRINTYVTVVQCIRVCAVESLSRDSRAGKERTIDRGRKGKGEKHRMSGARPKKGFGPEPPSRKKEPVRTPAPDETSGESPPALTNRPFLEGRAPVSCSGWCRLFSVCVRSCCVNCASPVSPGKPRRVVFYLDPALPMYIQLCFVDQVVCIPKTLSPTFGLMIADLPHSNLHNFPSYKASYIYVYM